MTETTPPADRSPTGAKLYAPGGFVVPDAEFGELQVARSPLFERATAHLEREITVETVGGSEYRGRLTAIGEDGVLTVVDGDDIYEIDVEHVSVIESQRQR